MPDSRLRCSCLKRECKTCWEHDREYIERRERLERTGHPWTRS